ncbi:MAG: cadherin-like beta sandwich domain-containing protein [Ruminococcus sp.]|nr:cadherin-like beta sandwich domain-containing protein [Ruminococcus sp.]
MKKITAVVTAFCSLMLSLSPLPASPAEAYEDKFEEYLTAQNFPESYKPALRKLHEQHPNWVFTALRTGLEWSKVLNEETQLGRSLLHESWPDSWKSLEKGAYNLETGTWYGLDGSKWVAASDESVAYYLDPRNFLDDTYIFMFEKLSYQPEIQTRDGVYAILKGTFMEGDYTCPDTGEVKNYIDTFMEAAERSGVSPYHLATSCRMEQGVNGSVQSLGTAKGYEGYFNFFDIQAYATATLTAGQQGARYAKTVNPTYLLPWTNQYKSIIGGAIYVGAGYITKEQDCYYLQKFDVTDGGNGYFYHQYMSCVSGHASLAQTMKKAYSDELLASPLEFKIPVYKNMPAEASPRPDSRSKNNLLSSVTAAGQTLSPSFNAYTTEYKLEVPYDISSLTLYAKAYDSKTKISGTGQNSLKVGENKLKVTATAEDGSSKVYTVTVTRAKAPDRKKGDVNGDKQIDVVDALMILKYSAGSYTLTEEQLSYADMDGSGTADVIDALMILRIISGQ